MKGRYGVIAVVLLLAASCAGRPEKAAGPQPEPPTPVVLGGPVPLPKTGLNVAALTRPPSFLQPEPIGL